MFKECRFILPSGYKCKSPALRSQSFCYFHTAARRFANIRTTSAEPLPFPSIEDTGGVQIAIDQILRGVASGRLDSRQAGVLFYGLQIAARLARKSDRKPSEIVRETCEDPEGGQLATEKSTCEPPADCLNCRRRDFCPDFELWESDAEELEERLEAEREAKQESEPREETESDDEED